MTQSVTRCPQCNTTFRVTEAQLQVAKGKVRCGSCLHVFKAADHWVSPPAAAPKAAPPKTAAKGATGGTRAPASGKSSGKFKFDQASIDSASADKVLTKPAIPAVNTLGEMRVAAAKSPVKDDEDLAGLISDEEDEVVKVVDTGGVQTVTADDYSDVFINLDDLNEDDFTTTSFESLDEISGDKPKKKKAAESADESWAKELLEVEQDDSSEREAQVKKIFSAGLKDNVFIDDGHIKKRDEDARDGFVSGNRVDPMQDLGLDKATPPPRAPLNRKELLSKIEPAPVDMAWSGQSRDWLGMLMWSMLTFVAILCLAAQYAWINFENLAREQQYRPLYAKACASLGCTLPDMFNPAAIRSYNLVVRTDPQINGVLVVDAMLQNDASYSQPFPDLELYFSDLDNFPVASRRFQPSEYLEGEMAGKTQMPPAKSIHVSLQIVDPGSKAVNYRLQISDRKPVNSQS